MTSAAKPKGGPRGPIDIILDKLQPNIHTQLFGSPTNDSNAIRRRRATLVTHAEEALRLLTIKRVHLVKYSAMVRAALVIDYLSRNAASSASSVQTTQYCQTTVPTAMLANAIGLTNKKDMKKLHSMQTVIASYLDGTSIDQRKKVMERTNTQKNSRKRSHAHTAAASSLGQSDANTADTTTRIKPTSLIRQLCIQLGTMIADAEFVHSYAIQLFIEVQSSSNTATTASKRSNYELDKDMERNQVYYEAACFYLAVMKSEGDRSHSLMKGNNKSYSTQKKESKSKKKGEQLNNGLDDEAEEDNNGDDDERPLNEMDVIREANLIEGTFRTVLAYVRDWTKGVSISLPSDRNGTSTDRLLGLEVAEAKDGGQDDGVTGKNNPSRNVGFERWKVKVLNEAKMSVMEQMKEGDKRDWLSLAAEEVLSKAGL
ncbi:hypothetical protein ACHAXH_000949 [Discostella pseudostelligera]